jgi:pimeloyl-ACP methyl ester carboxylesterase
MKILEISGTIIITLLAIAAIILIAFWINHNYQLRKEAKTLLPPGNMVEVNGKKLHVFTEGDGDTTLVFMAGHGTSYPTVDFKPLWVKMVDEYRIAVVEKAGYGWSDTSNSPRDVDIILEETREALNISGENGPYILFPHSMSGLEAIYWAQKYPDEVLAIIGLDPTTPGSPEVLPEPSKIQLYFMYLVSRAGLSRFIPDSEIGSFLPLMKSHDLSEEDRSQYLAVFYKSTFTKDMLREIEYLKQNAETVKKNGVPAETPMYLFISDDQEVSNVGWKEMLSDYLSEINIGKSMQLDTGHYIHHDKANVIAEEAKAFLKEITN